MPERERSKSDRKEEDAMRCRGRARAHCAADAGTRRRFASDLLNLTLAAPAVNRHRKSGKDAGEWLPRENRCWFAARVVAVKRKYRLTVDAREARALEGVLSRCASTAMMVSGGRLRRRRRRPGAARSPGLALHARRRRGRRGVRVKARTGTHCRQQGNGGGDSWYARH